MADLKEVKYLLIDADSKTGFGNLALMKYSAYLKSFHNKSRSITIDLIQGIPDTKPLEEYERVYVSCVYHQNAEQVLRYAKQFPKEKLLLGGSGLNMKKLPPTVEHIMPDYSLYGFDNSMGFTSRGCIRKCKFCIVPNKEGHIHDHAPITEFMHPKHNKLILLDNNFGASPKWKENIQYLIDNKIKVNFNQGLDARIVTKKFAELLAQTKCYNWTFKIRGAHLAFDNLRSESKVKRALSLFENAGMAPKRFVISVLVGFNSSYKDDMYRIMKIKEWGSVPYVMRYNKSKDRTLNIMARYVNRKYIDFIPVNEYENGVLEKWK